MWPVWGCFMLLGWPPPFLVDQCKHKFDKFNLKSLFWFQVSSQQPVIKMNLKRKDEVEMFFKQVLKLLNSIQLIHYFIRPISRGQIQNGNGNGGEEKHTKYSLHNSSKWQTMPDWYWSMLWQCFIVNVTWSSPSKMIAEKFKMATAEDLKDGKRLIFCSFASFMTFLVNSLC